MSMKEQSASESINRIKHDWLYFAVAKYKPVSHIP